MFLIVINFNVNKIKDQPRGSMSTCVVYLPQHYTSAIGDRYGVFFNNGGEGTFLVTADKDLGQIFLSRLPPLPRMNLKCVVARVENGLIVFESEPMPLRGKKFKRIGWREIPILRHPNQKFDWVRAPEVASLGL